MPESPRNVLIMLGGAFFITTIYFMLVSRRAVITQTTVGAAFTSLASSSNSMSSQPSLKSYFQLLVDENGETSVTKRYFTDTEEVGYSNTPQIVKKLDPAFAAPKDVIFTALSGENPWHHCPEPQIVVCLGGGWYVKTTDGNIVDLLPGDVLYQDNTEKHPAAKEGTKKAMHFSGSLNGKPCDQMIVQLDLKKGPIENSKDAPPPL